MSKKYFYNNGKKQVGPLSLEELSKLPLKESDQVWVEGAEDWKTVSEYDELRHFITLLPPPIKRTNSSKRTIAIEIKRNLKLIFLALLIGICTYPVVAYFKKGFTSLSLKSEYTKLVVERQGGEEAFMMDTVSTATINTSDYQIWTNKKEQKGVQIANILPDEDKEYIQPYEGFRIFKITESLDNNI